MLPFHTILHANDLTDASEAAFQVACGLARDYKAHLIVVYVWSPVPMAVSDAMPLPAPTGMNDDLTSIKDALAALVRTHPHIQISYRIEEGEPVDGILRVANATVADLIVMGTHGYQGLTRLLLGSVAEKVLRDARCPVLTVKSDLPDKEAQPALVAHEPLPAFTAQAV